MARPIVTFGLKSNDMDDVAKKIGDALDITMEAHDSDEVGERYFSPLGFSPELEIYSNKNEDEEGEYLRHTEYAEFPLIVMVVGADRDGVVERVLTNSAGIGATLLDRLD